MKKAFCEPGNLSCCPPINFADALVLSRADVGSFEVKRSPENGGNKCYSSVLELQRDFADGSLHPSDLKAATTEIAVAVLDKLACAIKLLDAKTLKAYQKKLNPKSRK
jgi:tyrosyl-tRNA synthetase